MTTDEIYEEVVELEKFDDETLAVLHNPEKRSQTEIGYRLVWARTYLNISLSNNKFCGAG